MRAPTNAASRCPSSKHEGGWPQDAQKQQQQQPAAAGRSSANRAESVGAREAGGAKP